MNGNIPSPGESALLTCQDTRGRHSVRCRRTERHGECDLGVDGVLGRKTKQGEEGMKSNSDLKNMTQGPRDSVWFHVHVCPEGAAPQRWAGGEWNRHDC